MNNVWKKNTNKFKVFIGGIVSTITAKLIDHPNECEIKIVRSEINDLSDSFKSRDFFEALILLRLELEKIDGKIALNGSRRDVFPSGMSRQMARGLMAYQFRKGEKLTLDNLVDIFDSCNEIPLLTTVEEQKNCFLKWYREFKE